MNKAQKAFEKAKTFMDSMASRGFKNAKIHKEVKDVREISCHGLETAGIDPCPSRMESKKYRGSFYCGACNCGDFQHTQLKNLNESHYSKLDYPRVQCPLHMPGFTNYIQSTEDEKNDRKGLIEMTFGVSYLVDLTIKETQGE